jgi:gas vesicle protein
MNSGKVLLGVLAGAAAGALLGVLLAPEKGTVTREKLAKLGDDYTGDITDKIKELRDSITDKIDSFREDGNDLVEKGKAKFDQVKKGSSMGSTGGSSAAGGGYSSHGTQNS